MTDFFNEQGSPDDFALPGDDAILASIRADEPEPETETPEPVAEQTTVDEPADDRPRNPDGTFAKKEDTDGQPEPELILGKFKSPEELAAAYQELESFKGRQSSEISELRQALEQRFTTLEQQAHQPVTPQTPVTQDLIDANPGTATELAYQQGNQAALAAAFEAWELEQPARAAAWIAQKQIEQVNAQWAERYNQLEQKIAPVEQRANTDALADGVGRLRQQYPDIGDFLQGDEFAQLADQIPLAKKALTEGRPDEVVSAIETVYLIHRGRASDNLKDTTAGVARAAAQEAQQMREEAFVASASATTTAPPRSRADELAAGWDDKDSLFESNWNV